MTRLETAVLAMLRDAWHGHGWRLRRSKLAKALNLPLPAVARAISALEAKGEISFSSSPTGRLVTLTNPPAEHGRRHSNSFTLIRTEASQ